MNEEKNRLEMVRKRTIVNKAYEDLGKAIDEGDYKAVKVAESLYTLVFELYEQESDDRKETAKKRLEGLSQLIDKLNDKLIFKGAK